MAPIVANLLDNDHAAAMPRFDNGVRSSVWATQAAAGLRNHLRMEVSCSEDAFEWIQGTSTQLTFKSLGAAAQIHTPNGLNGLLIFGPGKPHRCRRSQGVFEGLANHCSAAA